MHISVLLSLLFISSAVASEQHAIEIEDSFDAETFTEYTSSYKPVLIGLPDEVKQAIKPPQPIKSWEDLEWVQFRGDPFDYNLSQSSFEDLAKLHVLNANSGKFYDKLSDHAANFDGDLNDVEYNDFMYLYYNGDDSLELDYSIPYFTGMEAASQDVFLTKKFLEDKTKYGGDYVESHREKYYTDK